MKKLIIISTLLTFTIFFNSHGAEQSKRQRIKTELKDASYAQITESIDNEFNQKRKINQLIQSKFPGLFIKYNQSKLKNIESDLLKKEDEQIFTLLQDCGMNKKQIGQIFLILQTTHEARKKYLSQTTHMNATHDTELTDHINAINKQLMKKRFNSNNINIKLGSCDGSQADNAQHLDRTYAISSDGLIENYFVELYPDTIGFNPLYVDYEHKLAIILHEAEHSIQGHHIIQNVIYDLSCLINKICHNVDIYGYYVSSPEWHKLTQIHEQQADIFPAIGDAESASAMRAFRRSCEHSWLQDRYYDHYFQLSEIDERHKMIALLKKANIRAIKCFKQIKPFQQSQLHQSPQISQVCWNAVNTQQRGT